MDLGSLLSAATVGVALGSVVVSVTVAGRARLLFSGMQLDFQSYRRPVTRGVVICDWVDVEVLASIARQKGLAPEPVRVERGEELSRAHRLQGAFKVLTGGFERGKKQETREFYEPIRDPNELLLRVVGLLDEQRALVDTLDELPTGGGFDPAMIDELVQAARSTVEREAAAATISQLQATMIERRKGDHWLWAAEEPRFVLLESEWWVEWPQTADADEAGWFYLNLSKLREPTLAPGPSSGNPPESPTLVGMPGDLGLHVRLSTGHLTPQGTARLRAGNTVKAGVFGTTASYEDGDMWVTPVAVYSRVE
jgi:hypothetical protein